MSHQLCSAPGDAVAGDIAEVAASRDFDFVAVLCCALPLVLWLLNPLETV